MKKFKFRLEKILDVKEIELKKLQKDLSVKIEEKNRAEEILQQLIDTTNDYARRLDADTPHSAAEFDLHFSYFHQLLEEAEIQKEVIHKLEEEENSIREKLMAVQREQKMLANLKENARQKYMDEVLKSEQKILDEFAILGSIPK